MHGCASGKQLTLSESLTSGFVGELELQAQIITATESSLGIDGDAVPESGVGNMHCSKEVDWWIDLNLPQVRILIRERKRQLKMPQYTPSHTTYTNKLLMILALHKLSLMELLCACIGCVCCTLCSGLCQVVQCSPLAECIVQYKLLRPSVNKTPAQTTTSTEPLQDIWSRECMVSTH